MAPARRTSEAAANLQRQSGGRSISGTTAAQVSILERALTVGVDYVDVEASIGTEAVRQLFMHRGQTKLIVSAHEFATGTDPSPLWKKLSTLPADLHKLAFAVEDFADLEPLLDLQSSQTGRKILIGMGDAGVPSRMLYKRFGSAWTYVHDGDSVAPGQLDADTAERWALDRKQDAVPYGLLGGDSVFRSPGPRVYNTLFIQHALNAIYVPLKSSRVEAALRLAKRLGFGGLSVTMPAKREVLPYLSSQDDIAARAGAVNTIHFDGDELYGENSDAAALQQMVNGAEGTILLLGAGSCSSAARCNRSRTSRNQRSQHLVREATGRRVRYAGHSLE